MLKSRYIILLFIALLACNKSELNDFDSEIWIDDPNGCKGDRVTLVNSIIEQKEVFVGNSQTQVTRILGKPDRHELQSRNKKTFIYFLEDGPECKSESDNPSKLLLRFDALGRVKEVVLYKQ
jgi:hypothetical protein